MSEQAELALENVNVKAFNPQKTSRNLLIAQRIIEGKNQGEIAKEVDLSQQQVSVIVNEKNIKQVITNTINTMALRFPKVADRLYESCTSENNVESTQAIKEYHKALGVGATHTPISVQNLYVDNRTQVLAPGMQELLGASTGVVEGDLGDDDDIIDGEWE